jgi:hypothetical protein
MRFATMTSEYQCALSFGVRRWVLKLLWTIPKRREQPSVHLKFSRNDQTKSPVIGVPHATARLPDGTVRPLIDISRWSFRWQDHYFYMEPSILPKGTVVRFHWEDAVGGVGGRN